MAALDFTMFPERDFVEVGGLAAGDRVDVELVRAGVVVGQARNIDAFQEGGAGPFIVLVNHPSEPSAPNQCWDVHTPDVLPGDVVRATVISGPSSGPPEEATVANVTVTQKAFAPVSAPGTIVVTGTAQDASGQPLPLADIEQRLIKPPATPNFTNGTRRLSAPGSQGELAYDPIGPTNPAPGIKWTATYTGLTEFDHAAALDAESRILHLGGPLPGNVFSQITIFETPVDPGPFDPVACPALSTGPALDLPDALDTGASSFDNVTRDASPAFSGVRGSPDAGSTVNLYDTTTGGAMTLIGTTTLAPDGRFTITPTTPLSNGQHALRAGHTLPGSGEVLGATLTVTIDNVAPAPPAFVGSTPASPANNNSPLVRGTAERGSTVRLFTGAACTGTALVSTAETFESTGLSVPVADNSTSRFTATAQDLAGNVSPCSSGLSFQEVTPPAVTAPSPITTTVPTATTTTRTTPTTTVTTVTVKRALATLRSARVKVSRLWRAPLTIACTGPSKTTCSGKVTLLAKRPPASSVKAAAATGDVVIGTSSFVIRSGKVATVKVTLNARGRAFLAGKSPLRVRAKVVALAGSGVARASRTTLTLVAPPQGV